MIHQQLLRQAVAGRSPALVDFMETVAPCLLERFTTIPALGGSGRLLPLDPRLPPGVARFTEEEMARFGEKNPDQSLTAHILNGLFAGLRLAEWLPVEKALSDLEQRLWILGYVVHDYTKVYGIKIQAGQLDVIREMIRYLGQDLAFDSYFTDWSDYLDDIVFLAQNTQKVEGANLNLRDYRLKTHPRRLDVLRYLSSYADVLVHIKSPSDVMLPETNGRNTAENLRKMLDDLFGSGQAPRLVYHKLSDVRGLLSNLVHNVVIAQLREGGYEPYLFFPNGVVYLANPSVEAKMDPKSVADTVWEKTLDIIGESETFGVKPWTTGLQVSSGLYEMAGLTGVLQASRRRLMRLTSNNAPARLYGFFTGKSGNDLKNQFGDNTELIKTEQETLVKAQGIPSDGRVHKLGEFLSMIYQVVSKKYKKATDLPSFLLQTLNLQGTVTPEDAKRQKGGVYFGWLYAAARYVQASPSLDDASVEDVMRNISEQVLSWVETRKLEAKTGKGLAEAIKDYVVAQLEVDGRKANENGDGRARFERELSGYVAAKEQRKCLCSMCSSPYRAVEQEITEVPFANQQYSNKNPLDTGMLVRGVCPVCRIEMILRLVQQEGLNEERKPIQMYLYPTYFFTSETSQVLRYFTDRFRMLNLFGLRNELRQSGFSLNNFLQHEGFLVTEEELPKTLRLSRTRPPKYAESDQAGFFFLAIEPLVKRRLGEKSKITDTDSWAVPALLAVGLPLLLDVKVVATSSFVPLFYSGADFQETAILDGPHAFTSHLWGKDRFRVDELEEALIKLLNLHDLHLDVFAEGYDPHWPQLNAVAKDIATDPYYTFSYYERKERSENSRQSKKKKRQAPLSKGISRKDLERYFEIYQVLGGKADMGIIGEIVDAYAAFYRAQYGKLDSAYAVLKPFTEAADVVVESLSRTQDDDLILLVEGAIHDLMNRVWDDPQTDGWDPIVMVKDENTKRDERKKISRQKQAEFAQHFVAKLFHGYCNGDRATLREQLKRLRSAARFYYLQKYGS